MSKADRAMGDIDAASSPSSQNSPEDPGKILGSIDLANHGGINQIVNVSYEEQCPGSTVSQTSVWMDDVAQYRKADNAEQLRINNQAMGPASFEPSNPPLIGIQDSDPKGG